MLVTFTTSTNTFHPIYLYYSGAHAGSSSTEHNKVGLSPASTDLKSVFQLPEVLVTDLCARSIFNKANGTKANRVCCWTARRAVRTKSRGRSPLRFENKELHDGNNLLASRTNVSEGQLVRRVSSDSVWVRSMCSRVYIGLTRPFESELRAPPDVLLVHTSRFVVRK